MPSTRWSKDRLVHLGFLIGRGYSAKEIAAHRDIESTGHAVAATAQAYGYAFPREREAGVHVELRATVLRTLEREARRRRILARELASVLLTILAEDATLLANVLDDDAAPVLRNAPANNDNRIIVEATGRR